MLLLACDPHFMLPYLCITRSWLSARAADIFLLFTYFNTCYYMQEGIIFFFPEINKIYLIYIERNILVAEYSETDQ